MDSAFFSKKSKNIQLIRIEDYEKNHAIHKTMLPYFFSFIEICLVPVLFERPISNHWNAMVTKPFLAVLRFFR